MPFVTPKPEDVMIRKRRILISGSTGMRKTTAALTAPKPLHIMSYPGEKGYDTIPLDNPGIKPYIWEYEPMEVEVNEAGVEILKNKTSSSKVLQQVRMETNKILSGVYGPCTTFVGDGLHKLYQYFLDKAAGGLYFTGGEIEGKHYGVAGIEFMEYINTVCHSNVPVVIFTIWDADEKDRPLKPGEQQSTYKFVDVHKFPDLPGKLAKRILGEFSVTCGAVLKSPKPGVPLEAYWQLSPGGDIHGVGVKIDAAIAKQLPQFIPANYDLLANLLMGAELEAQALAPPVSGSGGVQTLAEKLAAKKGG